MELTAQQINEGNLKIAKFLEWYQIDTVEGSWYENQEFAAYVVYSIHNNYPHRDLPFHRDWNWIMKVIEKIEYLGYVEVTILGGNLCMISSNSLMGSTDEILCAGITKITAVWSAVVQFIDWYGKNKKK